MRIRHMSIHKEKSMDNQIGEKISQSRQNQKMTQEEFASRLGVTPQAVSKWERGLSLPDIALVGGICQILHISANELLGIKTETKVTENGDAFMQEEIKNRLIADPLLLEIGVALIPVVIEGLKGNLINMTRKNLAAECGYLMPLVRIRDNEALGEDEVRIFVYGEAVVKERMLPDASSFPKMAEALAAVCREHYAKILNKSIVKTIVDNVKELYPGVADGLIPEQISYLTLELVLKELIRTGKNMKDFLHIVEGLEWEILSEKKTDVKEIAEAIAKKQS